MHLRAIIAIARKDALDILVNRSTLIGLLTPIFLALIFALIGQIIGTTTSDILIYDPGNSPLEQSISAGISHPHFVRANSADEVTRAFGADGTKHSSTYTVGLVIPAGFESALQQGQHLTVQLYVNGDRSSPQQERLLSAVITTYARQVATPTDPVVVQAALINPPAVNDLTIGIGTFYALAAVMSSFFVGMSLVSNMVVEEREKKTLRMLLVSPASLVDIIVGKSAVALVYQLILALVTLGITGGFIGQLPLLLGFVLIGSFFTLALGLVAAGLFQTTSGTGAFGGIAVFLFILPVFFIAPFFGNNGNIVVTLTKLLPTYYIGDGIYQALAATTTAVSLGTDLGVSLGVVAALFGLAVWLLHRQAAVTAIA